MHRELKIDVPFNVDGAARGKFVGILRSLTPMWE